MLYALPVLTLQLWENTFVLGLFLLGQSMVEPGEISAVFLVQACWQYQTGWLRGSKENKPSTTLFGDQLLILLSKRSRKICPCNDDYSTQNLQSGSWKSPEALN